MIYTMGYTFGSKKGMKMANIKTAISIEKPLFEEVAALAEEMEVSRSYLFTLAARDFIQHHKSQKLLDAINATYDDLPNNEEERLRAQIKSKHRQLVKDRW
jgi:metal-responsive CopG/Arc/MetJ family transcriptional regulator